MKIVHIIEYFQPKLGYQEFFLAKEQTQQGHDVTVITSDRYDPLLYEGDAVKPILGDRINKPGFFIEEGVRVIRLKSLLEIPSIGLWLQGLEIQLKRINPEYIHVHSITSISAIRIAILKLINHQNTFVIFDDHMTFSASRSNARAFYPIFKIIFSKIILKSSNKIVAVSNTSKNFIIQKYGIEKTFIEVIPLGVDIQRFTSNPELRKLKRNQFSIRDDEVLFIYSGKIKAEKGPDLIISAAYQLKLNNFQFKILFLGNGPKNYLDHIRNLIDEKDLGKFCYFHNPVPNNELPSYYCAADVAIWPKEASLSMLEAMACGIPVIISDKSEVTERVNDSNGGLIFEHENPDDLAKKMIILMEKLLREKMGENAKKFVQSTLNWKLISDKFLKLKKDMDSK